MKWRTLIVNTTVGWLLVFSAMYADYFTTGLTPAKNAQVRFWVNEFRWLCHEHTQDRHCMETRVSVYWKQTWVPPYWLWKTGFVEPFVGVAPFYFLPLTRQSIMLEPRYWDGSSEEDNKETVFHEMGHAVLKWGHSSNPKSLMYKYGPQGVLLVEAFRVAVEENK